MSEKFWKISSFGRGFKSKRDVTVEEPGVAVAGSQNVQIIDDTKIGVRPGFSYLGARSSNRYGIIDGGSWKTSTATELPIRSYSDGTNGVVEVYIGSTWRNMTSALAVQGAKFLNRGAGVLTGWWSTTEVQDLLLFVDGSDDIFMWSGGTATFASATATTITLQGTATWAENRFLTTNTYGTRTIRVLDDGGTWREATYTGGEGTTTLTGTTDLTGFTISAGQPILQKIITNSNAPASGLSNDFLGVYLNYLFVFDKERNTIQMSQNTNYTTYTAPTVPRVVGEAASFNLDETPKGCITQADGDAFYISTKNQWYQFVFNSSSTQAAEEIIIRPLKTSPLEGATNELAITNMKNFTVYTSGEPTIDNLGRVENIDTPQSVALSDDIKGLMDTAGVTTSSNAYYKNNFYTTLREESADTANNRILTRNLRLGVWEAPWTIPASLLFEYNGDFYAHDPSTLNTYLLFDTNYADNYVSATNQAPIAAKWYSSHYDYGEPFNEKKFNLCWIDGYIRANTNLDIIFSYDFGKKTLKRTLHGTDDNVVLVQTGGGLGYYSLGNRSLGGTGQTLTATGLRRFRGFFPVPERPFYELQISLQSEQAGARWEVCSLGLNISIIPSINNLLKISAI